MAKLNAAVENSDLSSAEGDDTKTRTRKNPTIRNDLDSSDEGNA